MSFSNKVTRRGMFGLVPAAASAAVLAGCDGHAMPATNVPTMDPMRLVEQGMEQVARDIAAGNSFDKGAAKTFIRLAMDILSPNPGAVPPVLPRPSSQILVEVKDIHYAVVLDPNHQTLTVLKDVPFRGTKPIAFTEKNNAGVCVYNDDNPDTGTITDIYDDAKLLVLKTAYDARMQQRNAAYDLANPMPPASPEPSPEQFPPAPLAPPLNPGERREVGNTTITSL